MAMHQWLNCSASIWLTAVHQASIIALHQASMWLCIMQQYGSMLCIHGSMMCIRHQYRLMLYQASLYGSILCIRHCFVTAWLNAVQALIYGPVLCIRHHNTAQTCPSSISKARSGTTMSLATIYIYDSSCESCRGLTQQLAFQETHEQTD